MTGAVITSAGLVLAGTFSTLAVLPLVFLTEIGFTVAVGVLIDTFLVRSLLVPALVLEIGDRVWWPSAAAGRASATPHPNHGPGWPPRRSSETRAGRLSPGARSVAARPLRAARAVA